MAQAQPRQYFLVSNPNIVFLIGKEHPEDMEFITRDVFHFHDINKIKHLDQKLEDRLYEFFCHPCQIQLKSKPELLDHCTSDAHIDKEHQLIKEENETAILERKLAIEKSGLTTIKKTIASGSGSANEFVALSYMLELYPEEFDAPPIYVCCLLNCEFIGFANEVLKHVKTEDHRKGYLDVNGVLPPYIENESEDELISCLHEYDLESVSMAVKSPESLLKRVVNTFDYQCALIGKYPPAFQDHVTDKVMKDYEDNRQVKLFTADEPSYTPNSSRTQETPAKSRKMSESAQSDVYDHLNKIKRGIRDIVAEEFYKAGRLNEPSNIVNSLIQQLAIIYYQDEKLFFEDHLRSFVITDDAQERIRDRTLNFLYEEAKGRPTILTDFK